MFFLVFALSHKNVFLFPFDFEIFERSLFLLFLLQEGVFCDRDCLSLVEGLWTESMFLLFYMLCIIGYMLFFYWFLYLGGCVLRPWLPPSPEWEARRSRGIQGHWGKVSTAQPGVLDNSNCSKWHNKRGDIADDIWKTDRIKGSFCTQWHPFVFSNI